MLKDKSPQESFFGFYLYDKIVPQDHHVSSKEWSLYLPSRSGRYAGR